MPTCLLRGGSDYKIEIAGASYAFEMNERCGPMPLKELPPKHGFWRAVTLWAAQGERVEDGKAIWEEPREALYAVREIKQCECGEQMYRANRNESWTCWPCKLNQAIR